MATLGVVGGGGGRAAASSDGGRRDGDVATSTSPSSPSHPYQHACGADHLDIDTSIPSYPSSFSSDSPTANPHAPNPTTAPLLFSTASAARWRRKGGSLNNINVNQHQNLQPAKSNPRHRAASVHVRPIEGMEEVHGVDVSWLHRPNKDHRPNKRHTQSTPDVKKDVRDGKHLPSDHDAQAKRPQVSTSDSKVPSFPNVTPPTPVEPTKDTTPAYSSPSSQPPAKLSEPKRPGLFSRGSNEKVPQEKPEKPSKRTSWMTRISSKLDPQTPPQRPASTPTQPPKQAPSTPPTPNGASNEFAAAIAAETVGSPLPKAKDSSFFSSLKRTLSANSQTGGIPKAAGQGAPCARRVLNVDPNRERCNVPEMDSSRLRRVSFCVDVEIAGGPKYADDEDGDDKKAKKKDFKAKERAEGEALKRPEAIKEEKEKEGEAELENKVASNELGPRDSTEDVSGSPDADGNDGDRDAAARKREKKKQSEIERKERKEKRRRRAEESGAIPVELPLDGDADDDSKAAAPTNGAAPKVAANGTATAPKTPTQPQPHANSKQDRPTTDPVRIYRRCCQLRETPILKRITEQLMNPKCMLPDEPGVVHCLDLTGSRLQLADVVTLGDWLAVVPVKDLKLENADLSDEGVRCILAGLLAAKRPEPTKRKSLTPRHREGIPFEPYQERSGVVEKITLKNNPRLTRVGWKHISLFLYMCRSLRAIDLSENFFPETLPPSAQVTPIKNTQNTTPNGKPEELDAAEALYQCLSERLGGQKLEELIMSECGLSSAQIRKVVDGVLAVQVKRLGLAGNHLDDEGLEYVLEYARSGMCQALDLGANDLRGKLGLIGDAIVTNMRDDRPCWGLCLAGCNLDTASLKPLLAQLVKLPSFKFIDLSHNPKLCGDDDSLMPLLGRYLGQLPEFKRIHLTDVNMSPSQAISLANILPECPTLAHLNILENPQLTALANATTEADQEEACALYASLMAAVRVSGTLMCIDVDVPSAENSEIVQALAKQVVAYSLRNMETFAISEVTGAAPSTANATAALTAQHGGEKGVKEFTVPDVLMSLVGHVDGVAVNHDHDEPAPDEDYIVGGTGVVKALQYVLGGEKKTATPSPTTTGANTPTRPTSSSGLVEPGKAKKMSKNLLDAARKIRDRLHPALMKESAAGGDEVQYRRLMFLDQTLQNIIERFEEEYPETRLAPPSPQPAASLRSSYTDQSTASASATTQATDIGTAGSEDDEEILSGGDEEDRFDNTHLHHSSRQNSEVNLISRQQTREEGHLHRLGQKLRRDVLETPTSVEFQDVPWRRREEDERFRQVAEKIEDLDGRELRQMVTANGWDEAIKKLGANVGDLRHLQEEDPEAWELFKEAQEKAILNRSGSVAE